MSSSQELDLGLDLNSRKFVSVTPEVETWRPTFHIGTQPITITDSAMVNTFAAAGLAKGLATPRDRVFLARRTDTEIVHDCLALGTQSILSVTNMAQRLLARDQEIATLRTQIVTKHQVIKEAKETISVLQKQNDEFVRVLAQYSDRAAGNVKVIEELKDRLIESRKRKEPDTVSPTM